MEGGRGTEEGCTRGEGGVGGGWNALRGWRTGKRRRIGLDGLRECDEEREGEGTARERERKCARNAERARKRKSGETQDKRGGRVRRATREREREREIECEGVRGERKIQRGSKTQTE